MKYKKLLAAAMAASFLLSAGMLTGGCGSSQSQQRQQQAVKVTTFKPFTSDTPISREYAGSIMALQEVPVRSKVSGTVTEKFVKGGERVVEGQPLFRLDTRNYASNLAAAQAQVHRLLPIMKMPREIWHGMNSLLLLARFPVRLMTARKLPPKRMLLFSMPHSLRQTLLPTIWEIPL